MSASPSAAVTPVATARRGRGDAVGRYVILDALGAGGMGVVYRAYDPELDRRVALKLMLPSQGADREQRRARMAREAQAAARLSHANVVTVHDVGFHGDELFIALELIDGITLRAWLGARPRSWQEVTRVFLAAGRGLAAAHAADIVHRDFKPDNVIIGSRGEVKVCDFGIAAAAPAADDSAAPDVTADEPTDEVPSGERLLARPLTQTGACLGTPRYMAPEQLRGRADARSDQFSFCVALYEALYRQLPFPGDSLLAVMAAIGGDRPQPPPAKSAVPRRLQQAIVRGLRRQREERHASLEALLDELEAALPQPRGLGALGWAAVGAMALTAVAGTALLMRQHTRHEVCGGAASRLAGVWDGPRRAAVRAAFGQSGAPYAEPALRTVERLFDGYTSGWVAMHTEACEATHVRHEQSQELLDLRMSCLDDRLAQLSAMSDLFSRADAGVIEHAASSAQALPRLELCADAAALRAPVPPPADAGTRQKVNAVRERLARVQALWLAARIDDGRAAAASALDEAAALDYPPVYAEALLAAARLDISHGDLGRGGERLRRAWLAALAGRHDDVATEAALELVTLTGVMEGHYDEGQRWIDQAQAMVDRLRRREDLRADLFARRAALRRHQGRLDAAASDGRRALELEQRLFAADDRRLATTWFELGDTQYGLAHYRDALDCYEHADAIDARTVGPDHPIAIRIDTGIANVYGDMGDHEHAMARYRRALAAYQRINPRHTNVAMLHNDVGAELFAAGKPREALVEYAAAAAIWTQDDSAPEDRVMLLYNIGDAQLALGQRSAALARYDEALTLAGRALGQQHWMVGELLAGRGETLRQLGRLGEAATLFERARHVSEQALGATHPDLIRPLVGLARIAVARHAVGNAVTALERAVLIRGVHPDDGAQLAELRLELAMARWTIGDHAGARTAAAAAQATPGHGDAARRARTAAESWLHTHSAG